MNDCLLIYSEFLFGVYRPATNNDCTRLETFAVAHANGVDSAFRYICVSAIGFDFLNA
jgi:hypothetical protein